MKRLGFTISELLTAILIISVVMAASVPIITMRKNSIEKEKVPHGIFECYYDAAGNLHEYRADDKNPDGVDVVVEGVTYCEFDIPIANYYKIQAIGAGTDGVDQDTPEIPNVDDVTGSEYIINVGDFSTDTNIPSYVEEFWDDLGIKLNLKMTSSRGYSGATYCKTEAGFNNVEVNGVSCSERCQALNVSCPPECINISQQYGGASGKNIMLDVTFPLAYKALVSPDVEAENGDISFNYTDGNGTNHIYKLTSSATGSNAYSDEAGINGDDSTCSFDNNACPSRDLVELNNTTAPECVLPTETLPSGVYRDEAISTDTEQYYYKAGAQGQVCYSPETITVDKLRPKFSINIGNDGTNGNINYFIYPNLPGTSLTVTPARLQGNQTKISSDGNDIITVNIRSEASGTKVVEYTYLDTLPDASTKDFYYTYDYYDLPNLSIDNINDTKYRSMIDELRPSPGTKGKGFYTLLDSVEYTPKFTFQPSGGVKQTKTKDPVTINLQDTECKNSADRTDDGVCKATKGQPGAVRIVW